MLMWATWNVDVESKIGCGCVVGVHVCACLFVCVCVCTCVCVRLQGELQQTRRHTRCYLLSQYVALGLQARSQPAAIVCHGSSIIRQGTDVLLVLSVVVSELELCSQLARVHVKPRVCVYIASSWGVMRMGTCRNGNSNMLVFSEHIRRVPAYMPVTSTGGVKN